MPTGDLYDVVSDVDDCFTKEFREYVQEQDLLCRSWKKLHTRDGFKTRFWAFTKEQQLDAMDSNVAYTDTVDYMIRYFENRDLDGNFLLQFWKVEEVNSGNDIEPRQFLLSTRNQPFLLKGFLGRNQEFTKICFYRMRIVDIYIGDRDGVIGRVFRNKRMESTPDVGYYTYEEYPNLELAFYCQIKYSLALPLSDSSGRLLSVIELLSPFNEVHLPIRLREFCQRFQSICSGCCNGRCGQYGLQDNFIHPVAEIEEVMQLVSRSCNLVLGQAWMLCKLCNFISTCGKFGTSNSHFGSNSSFLEVESMHILQKGQEIVGKAASSPYPLVYSGDVTKFSIVEYPLAHFTRKYELSACCAIPIQSSYTSDQVYVLEFFQDPSQVEGRGLRASLVSIIEAMRQNFRTFKFACGEEFGDTYTLSVQVTEAGSRDTIVTLENRGLDLNFPSGVNNDESGTRFLLQRSINETSTDETDAMMIGVELSSSDASMEEDTPVSFSTVESKFCMNVEAYYGGALITLQLSESSGFDALKEQISQRFKLRDGAFSIKYQDDANDWILIACDEDVHGYISCSTSLEKYKMLIELKDSS